jgi:hypothetical protein
VRYSKGVFLLLLLHVPACVTLCAFPCCTDRLKKMAIKQSSSGSTGTAGAAAAGGKAPGGRTAARAAARAAATKLADDSEEGGSDFEDDLEVC